MIFARIVFWVAGTFGLLALVPLYRAPGNATYYGLLATLVAWQAAFFVIGWRLRQFRPLMIPAVLERVLWMATLVVLRQVTRTHVERSDSWLARSLIHRRLSHRTSPHCAE
jgi:hypothetical protein